MADCLIPVTPGRYDGAAPGFEGDLKAVAERVAYMAGVTVNELFQPKTGCSLSFSGM